jgi:hypothetical protein
MLAGIGAGVYRDAGEAIARCVRTDSPIEPAPGAHAAYEEPYRAYRDLAASRIVRRPAAVAPESPRSKP